MVSSANSRQRLLDAAAELIRTDPDRNVSVRDICARAGVQLPTLYHFFESKRGLLDAVAQVGYERVTARVAAAVEAAGEDPFDRLRAAWDASIAEGVAEPLFSSFMYSRLTPGRASAGSAERDRQLLTLTSDAAARGLLVVTAEEAAARWSAAMTGVIMHLVGCGAPDDTFSAAVREATLDGIRRPSGEAPAHPGQEVAIHAAALAAALGRGSAQLPAEESSLLVKWLGRLADTAR